MKIPQGRQAHLLGFVALHHGMQVRKYTGEPYTNHLRDVANMADGKCKFGYEVGLCHDLLEDTECTVSELGAALLRFKYDDGDVHFICSRVEELTDVFIPDHYPEHNRYARKYLEALRLHSIHPDAQTVKYCDLINNTERIVKHDKGFAKKYLAEKADILSGMDRGNKVLYRKCLKVLELAQRELANPTNNK